MFKKIDSNPKTAAIVYGTVSSILASAIWQFAPSFNDWLSASSISVLVNFVNARYARAATLEGVNYSFFVLTAVFVALVVLWIEISSRIKKRFFSDEAQKKDKVQEKNEPPSWQKKIIYFMIQFWIPLYLFYGLIQISGEVIVLNAITDFKQHMLIVAPYISKDEKDKLFSQWSQMRSLDDYNKIYERLKVVAKINNLRLYRNRMY